MTQRRKAKQPEEKLPDSYHKDAAMGCILAPIAAVILILILMWWVVQ